MPAGGAQRPRLAEPPEAVRPSAYLDKTRAVRALLGAIELSVGQRQRVMTQARDQVQACRARRSDRSLLDSFLQEFRLSNEEGVAPMCLAESRLGVRRAASPLAQGANAVIDLRNGMVLELTLD